MIRTLVLTALLASPAAADEALAMWGSDSGSLPPQHAWSFTVSWMPEGKVVAEYCKGYADAAPGCATAEHQMTEAEKAALVEVISAVGAALHEEPPQSLPDDQLAIGGGSTFGFVVLGEDKIRLPSQPRPEDAELVAETLKILADHTPKGLVDTAAAQAKAP